ncbi:hypothetical protein ACLX1H_004188 [Fusarium chlamydosporum]
MTDDFDNDTDSSLGEDVLSSTASISSSILDYRRENGRTYHAYKDGNLQHNLFLLTLDDKLGLAPPNEPDSKAKHVLDVGTGTGIWATDYADEHPDAQVTGVDLSPIQPAFNLAPDGYMEIQEADLNIQSDDGTLKPDNVMLKSLRLLNEASVKFGRPYQDIPPLADIMKKVGFVDFVIKQFRWPINGWPKDKKAKLLGEWCYVNMASGLEAFTMAPLTRAHGWTPEEVNLFLVDQRKAMADKNTHAYWPM